MELNKEKMKNLVLYVCEKCTNKDNLGAIKLNKILYYSDFINYLIRGKSITNETYKKRQFGPVPNNILSILNELKEEKKIIINDKEFLGHTKREYIPLSTADISLFNADEISLIDQISRSICENHTASSISLASHDRIWELAEIGEEIPYYTIFASSLGEIDEDDLSWAKDELKRLNKVA